MCGVSPVPCIVNSVIPPGKMVQCLRAPQLGRGLLIACVSQLAKVLSDGMQICWHCGKPMELAWWLNTRFFTSRMALSPHHHQPQCLCVCLMYQSLQATKDSCHVMTVRRKVIAILHTKKSTPKRCMLKVILVARRIMRPPFLHSSTTDICVAMNMPCPVWLGLHTTH